MKHISNSGIVQINQMIKAGEAFLRCRTDNVMNLKVAVMVKDLKAMLKNRVNNMAGVILPKK